MHITILTIGSRGDVQPFIALGQGLQRAGHKVKLATHANFESMTRNYGLDFSLIEGDVQANMLAESGQKMLDAGGNIFTFMRRYGQMLAPMAERALVDSWAACQGTDAIIAHGAAFWGYDIAQKLGVPFYLAGLQPFSPNRDFPHPMMPPALRLGGLVNQLSYLLMWQLFWQLFRKPINQWRGNTLNLPTWQQIPFRDGRWQQVPILYGYSPTVIPKPRDWTEQLHVTGYWFLDSPLDFSPPPELVDFLEAGKPPVYIGFGSMTGRNPELMTEIALSALAKTGQRGILLTGWGGISNVDLPDSVFKIDSIPHNWLFPQMAAIVHHGGAGTTAAALRAGVPSIVIPFIVDQPFWGHRVAQLGVGPKPIPKKKLTVERLAAAIRTAVEDQTMGQRAAILGQKIRSEDGIGQAVKAFHQHLAPQSMPLSVANTKLFPIGINL